MGALLYPSRPTRAETLAMIEAVAGEQAVQVTWYDELDSRLYSSPAVVASGCPDHTVRGRLLREVAARRGPRCVQACHCCIRLRVRETRW